MCTVYTQLFYIVQISVPHCSVAFLFNLELWKQIEITRNRTQIQEESEDTSANNRVFYPGFTRVTFESFFYLTLGDGKMRTPRAVVVAEAKKCYNH